MKFTLISERISYYTWSRELFDTLEGFLENPVSILRCVISLWHSLRLIQISWLLILRHNIIIVSFYDFSIGHWWVTQNLILMVQQPGYPSRPVLRLLNSSWSSFLWHEFFDLLLISQILPIHLLSVPFLNHTNINRLYFALCQPFGLFFKNLLQMMVLCPLVTLILPFLLLKVYHLVLVQWRLPVVHLKNCVCILVYQVIRLVFLIRHKVCVYL